MRVRHSCILDVNEILKCARRKFVSGPCGRLPSVLYRASFRDTFGLRGNSPQNFKTGAGTVGGDTYGKGTALVLGTGRHESQRFGQECIRWF